MASSCACGIYIYIDNYNINVYNSTFHDCRIVVSGVFILIIMIVI